MGKVAENGLGESLGRYQKKTRCLAQGKGLPSVFYTWNDPKHFTGGTAVRLRHAVILTPLAFALAGCEAVALTALGVGASTGVSQTMNGITYRTFTLPVPRVRVASLSALKRMGIKVESSARMENGNGEVIKAKT